MKQYSI